MSHSVVLNWTASADGVDGYNILRGTVAGAENATSINSALITGTTFTDVGPFNNGLGPYFYTAFAVKGSQVSVHSNETPAVFLPPAPPTNLAVSSVS